MYFGYRINIQCLRIHDILSESTLLKGGRECIEKYIICTNVYTIPVFDTSFNSDDEVKKRIIDIFRRNVKGKKIELDGYDNKYCGKEGHWLEHNMGIIPNSKNEPDLFGYEMKKYSCKVTLGDFAASEYVFSKKREYLNKINSWTDEHKMTRNEFIRCFGNPNPEKNNRYSWSGNSIPKYDTWNTNGQTMVFNDNQELVIYYSFSKDERISKHSLPSFLHADNIMIAYWKYEKMKMNIERKFNHNGFFVCKKVNGIYNKICFGKKFDYEHFVECFKHKKIIFDSGMYEGNNRPYSMFRANSSEFWNDLIVEEFE